MVFVIFPLTLIYGTVGIVIGSKALHFSLEPVTFIAFCYELSAAGNDHFTIAVLDLFSFYQLPVALVGDSVEVFELAIAC